MQCIVHDQMGREHEKPGVWKNRDEGGESG